MRFQVIFLVGKIAMRQACFAESETRLSYKTLDSFLYDPFVYFKPWRIR